MAGNLGNNGVADSGSNTNNPNPSYIGVPYNSTLSEVYKNGSWQALSNLTLSAWIYLPSGWNGNSEGSEIFSYYPAGTEGSTPGQVYQLGTGFQSLSSNRRLYFADGLQGGTAYDLSFSSTPHATPGKWMLITATYNGVGTGSNPVCSLYENGVLIQAADGTPASGPLLEALTLGVYSTLYLANGWGERDNEWTGGLSDLGIWNICLTGAAGRERTAQ